MGVVYKALDVDLDRHVALKFPSAEVWKDKAASERFTREAKAASALDHQNICTIYEIGRDNDGDPFIAMAYYEGETIEERIASGPMPFSEILDVAKQVTAGLAKAHECEIVHRDIKPSNLFLTTDGIVKILDFGVVKLKEASVLTETGDIPGTLLYMSPEHCLAQEVDHRTDVWALGAVLYEMATCERAFGEQHQPAIVYKITNEEPTPIKDLRPDTPVWLEKVIDKALEKDRERRFAGIQELGQELPESASEIAIQPPPRLGRRTIASAISGAILLALAAVNWPAMSCFLAPGVPSCSAVPVSGPSLTYWIVVQKYRDGQPYQEPFRLAREIVFEQDYRIFIHIAVKQAGYLYVLNQGPETPGGLPDYNLLFPRVALNDGRSLLNPHTEIQLPPRGGFQFDGQQGTEALWFLWSETPVEAMQAVEGVANPSELGVISNLDHRRAIQRFLGSHAASEPLVTTHREDRTTVVQARGEILVHRIMLEHQ